MMLRLFSAMLVLAGSLAAQGGGRVPVVLLNGWQLNCPTSPAQLAESAETFGTMEAQLRAEGYQVFYFNNCTEGRIPIEDLGAKFGEFLTRNNLAVVDVVAHSMGGLIIRAYLSGKTKDPADAQGNPTQFFNPPRATPPVQPRVRKAIFLGTPHYGAGFGGFVTDLQALQMQPMSQFLFDLATWNQGTDDLRGIDALAIVGDGGRPANGGDGLVAMPSASLYPFVELARVRVVGHCHSDSFLTRFGCASSAPNIAKVDSTSHETFRIVRSFLTDTRDWLAIGTTVQTAPYLTNHFGLFLTQANAQGQLLVPTTDWRATLQPTGGGAAVNLGTVRSSRVLGTPASAKTSYNLNLTVSGAAQSVPLNPAGVFGSQAAPLRPRPAITGVQPIVPAGQGKAVVSGAGIAISGAGFHQNGTEVLVNDAPVSSTILSDDALAATLPAAAAGGASLTVRNSAGTHRVNIVVQTPCTYTVSASPQQAPSGGGNGTVQVTTQPHCPWRATTTGSWLSTSGAASGLGSGTLAWTAAANGGAQRAAAILVNGHAAPEPGLGSGGYFSVFGANLAPATRTWEGRDFDGDKLPVQLDGTHVLVNGKAAYVYYISPTQINAIAPEDAATGAVSVQVVTTAGASNSVTAEKGPLSPALFLFDDRRYVIATYPDGSIVGTPNFPALRRPRAGDVITLWGTGFGPTAPMYPDGRVPVGAARTWNTVRVTIGGVEAQTDFAGLTGAGLYQFNVRLPAVSAGDQAVALEAGGARTPGGMFLAVQ